MLSLIERSNDSSDNNSKDDITLEMDGVDSDFKDDDDSNYKDEGEEDIYDDGEYVSDLPSDHPPFAWWLPGDVPPSEPQQH
eukprot:6037601-Ditylum_brightwellii.AAC.1